MQWMGIQDLGTFVLAVLVFLALPGPGTFALLAATGQGGIRAGYAAFLGLSLGDQILMWLAALGAAALLAAHPALFGAIRWAGAAYLVWVGVQLLRRGPGATADADTAPPPSRRFFRQGVLITLLNPKAIVFYMAFFPLFVDPAAHRGLATFAAMAALIALLSLVYCSLLILAGHVLRRRLLRRPALARGLRRVAGVALVGFGLRLGLQR